MSHSKRENAEYKHILSTEALIFKLKVKPEAEKKAGENFKKYQATEYRTQVVAGTSYFVKVMSQVE